MSWIEARSILDSGNSFMLEKLNLVLKTLLYFDPDVSDTCNLLNLLLVLLNSNV